MRDFFRRIRDAVARWLEPSAVEAPHRRKGVPAATRTRRRPMDKDAPELPLDDMPRPAPLAADQPRPRQNPAAPPVKAAA